MKVASYGRHQSALLVDACTNCGAPVLEIDDNNAVIAGAQGRFCTRDCIGEYRQQQTIVFR